MQRVALSLVNKRLDRMDTGIVFFAGYGGGGGRRGEEMLVYLGIPRGHKYDTRFFSSLVNRELYSTRAGFSGK